MTNHPYFTPDFNKVNNNYCETTLGEPDRSKSIPVHNTNNCKRRVCKKKIKKIIKCWDSCSDDDDDDDDDDEDKTEKDDLLEHFDSNCKHTSTIEKHPNGFVPAPYHPNGFIPAPNHPNGVIPDPNHPNGFIPAPHHPNGYIPASNHPKGYIPINMITNKHPNGYIFHQPNHPPNGYIPHQPNQHPNGYIPHQPNPHPNACIPPQPNHHPNGYIPTQPNHHPNGYIPTQPNHHPNECILPQPNHNHNGYIPQVNQLDYTNSQTHIPQNHNNGLRHIIQNSHSCNSLSKPHKQKNFFRDDSSDNNSCDCDINNTHHTIDEAISNIQDHTQRVHLIGQKQLKNTKLTMDKIKDFQDHLDVNFRGFAKKINKSVNPLNLKKKSDKSIDSDNDSEYMGGDDNITHSQIRNHIYNDIHQGIHHLSCN